MNIWVLIILFAPYLENIVDNFEPYNEVIPGTDAMISMVPVNEGEFYMGSDKKENGRNEDEGPVHKVKVDAFWMSKYEITWDQYETFLYRESSSEKFKPEEELKAFGISLDGISGATQPYIDMSFGMGKKGYPVINVTQYAALSFCKWLTALTGRFYRLPTEAEWEYAARAGTQTRYHFGDKKQSLVDYAWYKNNSKGKYHRVGTKKPNQWGLYDMHGNVSEWTMDKYEEDYYFRSGMNNPWNVPDKLYPRVTRGGSWKDDAENLRSAARGWSKKIWKRRDPQLPKSRWWHTDAPFVGFRIVRPESPPSNEEIKKYWLKVYEDY